jgi:hypothetical protein
MKRHGFTASDQEDIATKFQRIADDRGRRTGLGFSNHPTIATNSTTTESNEDKALKLKKSIKSLMKNDRATISGGFDDFSRHKIMEALNDEGATSLTPAINSTDPDAMHHRAIFSGETAEEIVIPTQPSAYTRPSDDVPIYKSLKVGDVVQALFRQDGKYYEADVLAVVHGGYPSAKYDIKFKGYSEVVSVSWRDIITPEKEVSRDEIRRAEVGQESESGTKLDEFGREVRESEATLKHTGDTRLEIQEHSSPSVTASQPREEVATTTATATKLPSVAIASSGGDENLLHPFLRTREKGAWKTKR